MSSVRQTFYKRAKASVRFRRAVAHQALRQRAPGVSRRLVRSADAARAVWFRRRMPETQRPLEQILRAYAETHVDATFVQVGAHDGTKMDPLRPIVLASGWRGVLVEPVPYVFARLQERYGGNPRLRLEQVAIADEAGRADFFYVPEASGLWHSYDALGSFRRDVVVSHTHLVPDIEDRVVSESVECITFDDLCDRNGLDTVNMVQIDTEGYDLHILRMIDLSVRRPDIVVFEHLHLSGDERAEAAARFTEHGYGLVSDGMDTMAVSATAQADPELARLLADARVALAEWDQ